MKKIGLIFVLVLFFIVTFQVNAQWYSQNSGVTIPALYGVCFLNTDTGFVVGGDKILKTTNEGNDWSIIYNATSTLYGVSFIDDDNGIVVGANGLILKTTNGGAIWSATNYPGTLLAVKYIGINHYCIISVNISSWYSIISTTTNGGLNWYTGADGSYILESVDFSDANNGMAVGEGGRIYKTTNGGIYWFTIQSGTNIWLRGVSFLDENNIFVVGGLSEPGIILKTTDSGQTWDSKTFPSFYLDDVEYIDTNIAVAVGTEIVRTEDGGENWVSQYVSNYFLFDVFFTDKYTGTAVGNNSVILRTINGGYTPVELSSFRGFYSNNIVQLAWSTASELNNHGFEIEKTADKVNWRLIGFIEGNGTTTETHNYSFVDDLLGTSSSNLYYRLKQIDFNGSFEYSEIVEVDIAPSKYSLSQNYPNPFNPSTTISYQLPNTRNVTIKVFDVLGREVETLVNEEQPSGIYNIEFNSSGLASGIYYYKIKAGEFVQTKKMILLK